MTTDEPKPSAAADYRVECAPSDRRVRVRFAGELVADSRRTQIVRETRHADVVYFPREDVRLEMLEASEHGSFCPFKGQARYWSFRAAGPGRENAVWSYEDPLPEVAALRGWLAFYADRVEWEFD